MSMLVDAYRFGIPTPPVGVTWDPAVLSPAAVLSMSDLRLTANTGASGTYANTRSTQPLTGDAYLSMVVSTNTGEVTGVGLGDGSIDYTNGSTWIGNNAQEVGIWADTGSVYKTGGNIGSGGSITNGQSVQIAVRTATRRVWIRINGGAWIGGGDPVANTTPTATLGGASGIYAVATVSKSGANSSRFAELAPDAGSTTGTVPSGFTAANWL